MARFREFKMADGRPVTLDLDQVVAYSPSTVDPGCTLVWLTATEKSFTLKEDYREFDSLTPAGGVPEPTEPDDQWYGGEDWPDEGK